MDDIVERLSHDAVEAPTLSASEHVHRYAWAASMLRGRRVLDLACGIGYGSRLLADSGAASVLGVDYSPEAISVARRGAGDADALSFEQADARDVLQRDLSESVDAIVCFEGLEHFPDLDLVCERLVHHASQGVRLVLSLPNSKTYEEDNPFPLTDFDWDGARALFEGLPRARLWFQHLAEGSLIAPEPGAIDPDDVALTLVDRGEESYANNFLCTVNVPDEVIEAGSSTYARTTIAPYYNRALRNLDRANRELWATNQRLDRQMWEIANQLWEGREAPSARRKGDTAASGRVNALEEAAARFAEVQEELHRAHQELRDAATLIRDREEELRTTREFAQAGWAQVNDIRSRKVVRVGLAVTTARLLPRRAKNKLLRRGR